MVVVPDGPSRRVGPGGLLIGRQGDCDIVATDPSVSRRHALVHFDGDGVEVVPLGKTPTTLNGRELAAPKPLADGDEIGVPGLTLKIAIDIPPIDPRSPARFVLERHTAKGAAKFGITHSPFLVGGGEDDDLIVKKWPAHAFALHIAQSELFVELRVGQGELNNQTPLREQYMEQLHVGDQLTYEGELFTIVSEGRVATTAVGPRGDLPTRATIEILPRGGRVVFTVGGRDHAVYLPDRRFDLVVALLRPPGGEIKPGEFVPDDAVRTVVWPRRPEVSRPELNTLISRCRRDLVEAGLAGPRLIERAQGGGAVRLLLAPGATVEVLS
jgi:hypothetical protein